MAGSGGDLLYVLIDGDLLPADSACLPVSDRGFLYGDAIYETLRAYQGRTFLLCEHLARLRQSAAYIYLKLPWTDEQLSASLERLLRANKIGEGRIRITVTRGDGDFRAVSPEELGPPRLVISAHPFTPLPDEMYARGVGVELSERVRNRPDALDPAIKSGNLLNIILARLEKRDPESFEVLLPNHKGKLTEGSHTNLFIVDEGGCLLTPSLDSGLLPGITRALVLELAAEEGVEARECELVPADLLAAAEAFITATTIEILPVVRVNGHRLSTERPGKVTRLLTEAYRRRIKA